MVSQTSMTRNGVAALAGGVLLMLVLGTVHAFSVFLEPLEAAFGEPRGAVSLCYSLALVCITISVLSGGMIFPRLSAARLVILLSLLGIAGLSIAGYAGSLSMVWIGFGLVFGIANGLGYGFSLQFCAQANPGIAGIAMGVITAAYGLGAALGPIPLSLLIEAFGPTGGFLGLAVALAVVGPVAAILFAWSGCNFVSSPTDQPNGLPEGKSGLIRLWIGYGGAVAAGLMAIGHASGIARAAGLSDEAVLAGPIVIAAANTVGSLCGGYAVDRMAARMPLLLSILATSIGLLALTVGEGLIMILTALGVIGFAYGAIIAAYPAAISAAFGATVGVGVYGRVFTAWGAAGLCAPWVAGVVYEGTGGYVAALGMAGLLCIIAIGAVWRFPSRQA